jgi:hypothetical protein
MNQEPDHFGKHFANRTVDWLPPDTKESYENLIRDPAHREYFANLGWDHPGAITYKFNSHGFRADEFDGGPYLLALGCSYTVGIGLPVESTWAYQTAQALNLKCANLAWGGYSADTCYRLAEYWVNELKPDYVCMLVPPQHRVELLLEDPNLRFEVFMPQSKSDYFKESDTYLKHWFLNEENARINQRKNIRAIKQLCTEVNIPCKIYNAEDFMCRSREEIGYARDYMHGGPIAHKILADTFIADYKKSTDLG